MMVGKNRGVEVVLPYIPNGSTGVEIGVWRGDSSERFLLKAGHLHLVDAWSVEPYRDSTEHGGFDGYLDRYKRFGSGAEALQREYDGIYAAVCRRFQNFPVTIHRCTSAEFFASMVGSVDWFYIDGDHSYEGCLADLEAAHRHASLIFGDDYGNKPGVTKAVNEFCLDHLVRFTDLGRNQYMIEA